MRDKKRKEFDSLGLKKVQSNKMWGAQTQRSLENFNIGIEKMPIEIKKARGKNLGAIPKTFNIEYLK